MLNWIIGGIVILVLIVSGVFLTNQSDNAMMDSPTGEGALDKGVMEGDTMTQSDGAMEKSDSTMEGDAMMKDEGAMTPKQSQGDATGQVQKGSYESYAASKLAKANEGHVVLFFRASWCPTCKALDSDIKANMSKIQAGLTILDVNYDTETALKQKYGVTYQHTLVQVDAQGNLITKWSGGLALSDLVSKVQ